MHQQQQSFTMSRALHGNNFALVRMVPGAPARTGGAGKKQQRGSRSFQLHNWGFSSFLLNAPCPDEEKKARI